MSKNKKIIFTLDLLDEWIPKEYYPTPGVKAVPDWYKNMKTSNAEDKTDAFQVSESQTIKRCMPVLDAITTGYILKTHTDIYVDCENGQMIFKWANDRIDTVVFHPPYQTINYRERDFVSGLPKLRNPWGIQTPKGYSCLFLPPAHRPEIGFRILEGIVDTDTYSNSVQFPFLPDKDFVGTIKAGTPYAQVIPFQRDSFRMEIGDKQKREHNFAIARKVRSVYINGYRNMFRANKNYL